MEFHRTEDWGTLPGRLIQIRSQGRILCTGVVDCVTHDGTILWIHPRSDVRRLIEKALGHEAWAQTEGPPAHLCHTQHERRTSPI